MFRPGSNGVLLTLGAVLTVAGAGAVRRRRSQGSMAPSVGVGRLNQDDRYLKLWWLLGWLKGFKEYAQQAHWRASGPSFYGDHQLLGRLYSGVDDHIDALGEQITVMYGPGLIDSPSMAGEIGRAVTYMDEAGATDLESLLISVKEVQAHIGPLVEGAGRHPGLQDLLAGIARTFDTYRYLLTQRLDDA